MLNKNFILCYLLIVVSFSMAAQQTDKVDFTRIQASVEPDFYNKSIKGTVAVSFRIIRNTDSIYLDALNMQITDVALEGASVSSTDNKIWLIGKFEAGRDYHSFFSYTASPKQALYFIGDQMWTQGQGKYTSHWLPSIDDMNDKIEFDLTIISDPKKTVIANGKLLDSSTIKHRKYWKWDMKHPMSSYLVAFVIGDYEKQELTSYSGIPIDLYFSPMDSLKVEPTYRYTQEIFNFLESEIGLPYPWQNYKQIPVRDFLYAGMENTTTTIFSEAFIVDSIAFNDRNYVKVNAHELAHQWFGNLITETSGTHHWLHEGFATYYALLAEKEIFGEDYYYWQLYNAAEQLDALSKQGKGESLLNPKASSLTYYEKGAWALHILKEYIGKTAFNLAVKNYLKKHEFKNVSTSDFLQELSAVTKEDISVWEADWLKQSAFKSEQVYKSLMKSEFMNEYFKIASLNVLPLTEKYILLKEALNTPNDFIGQEAIFQLEGEAIIKALPLYLKGFESNNLFVRQAIALSLIDIPTSLRVKYESLLEDNSYVTKESAFANLLVAFPDRKIDYLDRLKDVLGFQDKSFRQLWLYVAIITIEYRPENKAEYFGELRSYTSSNFSFEIREKSFGYIAYAKWWDEQTLRNLVDASTHHYWRFRNEARKILDEVIADPSYKSQLAKMMNSLSSKEQAYLNRALLK